MRWLIVVPYERPEHLGMDVKDALAATGREVRTFAYRRDNFLYKNRSTKARYERWILARLESLCRTWRPSVVLVAKGGPIAPELIRRVKRATGAIFLNVFPDNPLWMMPFERIEPYDLFFTKERYALRALEAVGLKNLYYLPHWAIPDFHHPVTLTDDERARYASPISFVGSRYPYRERFVAELADLPLRIWGPGWTRAMAPAVRALAAGEAVWGRAKLAVYCGSTLSLNHHHPMNDIVGVNNRVFELAASGACQVVDHKDELPALFTPGDEVLTYRDLGELRRLVAYHLAHPDEARAIGQNALRRALKEHTIQHRLEEIVAVTEARFGRRI